MKFARIFLLGLGVVAAQTSLKICHKKLFENYPAYEMLWEAQDAYNEALEMLPEQSKKEELELQLQATETFLLTAKMASDEEKIAWRRNLVQFQITWLQSKVKVVRRTSQILGTRKFRLTKLLTWIVTKRKESGYGLKKMLQTLCQKLIKL